MNIILCVHIISNLMNKCFNTLYAFISQLFIEMLIEFAPSAICPVVL